MKKLLYILFVILILISVTLPAYCNSAEPPSIIIIVPNAPNDLFLDIPGSEHSVVYNMTIEKQYGFYRLYNSNQDVYRLNVTSGEISYELEIPASDMKYSSLYTLDYKNRLLKKGSSILRDTLLISTRIVLTLLIEGLIFLMFRFKGRYNLTVFLIINLLTQGTLNIWLSGIGPFQSYGILLLIWGEIWVFLFEMITFPLFIKDRKKWVSILYVLIANSISLVLGALLISALPI